jgi:hypothetical protein
MGTKLMISGVALLLGIIIEMYIPGCTNPWVFNESKGQNKIFIFNSNSNHFQTLILKNDEETSKKDWKLLYIKSLDKKTIPNKIKPIEAIPTEAFRYPKNGKPKYDDIAYYLLDERKFPTRIDELETKKIGTDGKIRYKSRAILSFKQSISQYHLEKEEKNQYTSSSLCVSHI